MKLFFEMEKPEDRDGRDEKTGLTGALDMVDMYSQSATIHGVSKVAAPQLYKFRRFIWISLLLLMSVGLGTLIYLEFQHYWEYPSVTIVQADFRDKLPFPAVTICNNNQYHRDRLPHDLPLLHLLYNLSEFSEIHEYLTAIDQQPDNNPQEIVNDSGDYLYDFAMKAAHTMDEMFVYCSWRGLKVKCSDYFVRVVTDLGVCFRFEGNRTVMSTGPLSGLRVMLNIMQNKSFFSSTTQSGVKVLISEPDEAPNMLNKGLYIRPGTSTAIAVRKEESVGLAYPYRAFGTSYCYDTGPVGFDLGFMERFSNYTYTRETCQISCLLEHVARRCGCRHFFSPGVEPFCSIQQYQDCYLHVTSDENVGKVMDVCSNCPSRCHTTSYNTQLSSADFASTFIMDYMETTKMIQNKNYVKDNMIDLRIYFDTLTVTRTEQKPEITIPGIMADLGGHMGMFLGASLLSLTELVEFLVLLVMGCLHRQRKRKSTASQPAISFHGNQDL